LWLQFARRGFLSSEEDLLVDVASPFYSACMRSMIVASASDNSVTRQKAFDNCRQNGHLKNAINIC
jgi:hypothetical protein